MSKKCYCCNQIINKPYFDIIDAYYGTMHICEEHILEEFIDRTDNAITVFVYHRSVEEDE